MPLLCKVYGPVLAIRSAFSVLPISCVTGISDTCIQTTLKIMVWRYRFRVEDERGTSESEKPKEEMLETTGS